VRAILAQYIAAPAMSLAAAHYGFRLDADEQRRRYVIQSLFDVGGVPLAAYQRRFGNEALDDLPQLDELLDTGMATITDGVLALTEAGTERSDAIGPWLYSARVRELMGGYMWG
jgi:oxygen-independent coproporphyrinogen-3 oxidase